MHLILKRTLSKDNITIGNLSVVGDDLIDIFPTIELPWKNNMQNISCIPEGIYTIQLLDTSEELEGSKFSHYKHFEIKDVPNRTYIKIHIANYVRQLRGCIAIGCNLTDIDGDGTLDVSNSGKALKRLVKAFEDNNIQEALIYVTNSYE